MTQTDRIEIAKAKLRSLEAAINDIIMNNCMGDDKTKDLSDIEFFPILEALDDYEGNWDKYVESGDYARDFQEGELLRQAEARDD